MREEMRLPESSLMARVTGSTHVGDALHFSARVVDFVNEAVGCATSRRDVELSAQAMEGMCGMLRIVTEGIDEIYSTLYAKKY